MEDLLAAGAPWPGVVAVSGGGDSIALMHLLAAWARETGREPPHVVTVDHGLRKESAADTRKVMAWAKRAGLKSRALRWSGPHPKSDIEAAAREARYRLMGEHARGKKLTALYVGHTRDDQAETFLLRLMRGSGIDGLAAMRALAPYPLPGFRPLCIVRPLLALEREAVREHLRVNNVAWLEDPMNDEDRFARVRLRQLMPQLEQAGLTRSRIAAAAVHLTRAREALEAVTAAVLARAVRRVENTVHLDAAALTAAPREVGLRALAQLLMIVSGQSYRPRFERLERLFDRISDNQIGRGVTLHGCKIATVPSKKGAFGGGTLVIAREFES
jgi:tRNA(Ile)-lysidine synthase